MGCSSSKNNLSSVMPLDPSVSGTSSMFNSHKSVKGNSVVPVNEPQNFQSHSSGLEFRDAVKSDVTLVTACKLGSLEEVKRLLAANPNSINMQGMWSSTPLIIALQGEFSEIASLLLTSPNIDVNHVNEKGASALLYACMSGFNEIVKQLISKSVQIDLPPANSIYNSKFDKNMSCTPLSIACVNNHVAVVSQLLQAGCDPNVHFTFPAWKPSRKLASGTANESQVGISMTPLSVACASGAVDVVRELLHRQVDIQAVDAENMTSLHHAVRSATDNVGLEILSVFKSTVGLSKNLLDVIDINGNTALHLACENRLIDCCKILLEEGANVSARSATSGLTPLHIAVKRRQEELVDALLAWGADPLVTDKRGVSAMDLTEQLKKDHPIAVSIRNASKSWQNMRSSMTSDSQMNAKEEPSELVNISESIVMGSPTTPPNKPLVPSLQLEEINETPKTNLTRTTEKTPQPKATSAKSPGNGNATKNIVAKTYGQDPKAIAAKLSNENNNGNKLIEITAKHNDSFKTPVRAKKTARAR